MVHGEESMDLLVVVHEPFVASVLKSNRIGFPMAHDNAALIIPDDLTTSRLVGEGRSVRVRKQGEGNGSSTSQLRPSTATAIAMNTSDEVHNRGDAQVQPTTGNVTLSLALKVASNIGCGGKKHQRCCTRSHVGTMKKSL
ncbi:Hypothetical protein, putative [Bodo saltans]|uniref:Uncharacterized protein n=1 Tax=Bodo saltans TaxID=75058 RepID=A0A0S4KIA8_BODSA|nr:Hypothetical protein, putative [Bodo saltans]|eukprot:CUI14273.1 Hypothetical protein, putative [Bodo saltans]